MNPLAHWKAERLILFALDEPLSPTNLSWLDHHLTTCSSCRTLQNLHQSLSADLDQWVNRLPESPELDTPIPSSALYPLPSLAHPPRRTLFQQDWREFWGPVLAMAAVVAVIWTGAWRTKVKFSTPQIAKVMGGGEFLEGSVAVAQERPITFSLPRIKLLLAANSRMTFHEIRSAHTTIHLDEGTVTAEVVPGTPFTVKTPLGEARAKGTKFQVQLKEIPVPSLPPLWGKVGMGGQGGAESLPSREVRWTLPQKGGKKMKRIMTVIVLAGVAEVVNPFGSALVAAGQQAAVTEEKAPAATPLLNAETLGFVWKANLKQLVVAAVKPSSAAAEGTFQAGDIITGVEKIPVASPQAFEAELKKYSVGQKLLKVQVQRQAGSLTLWLVTPFDKPLSSLSALTFLTEGDPRVKRSWIGDPETGYWETRVDGRLFTGWLKPQGSRTDIQVREEYVEGVKVRLINYVGDGILNEMFHLPLSDKIVRHVDAHYPNGRKAIEVDYSDGTQVIIYWSENGEPIAMTFTEGSLTVGRDGLPFTGVVKTSYVTGLVEREFREGVLRRSAKFSNNGIKENEHHFDTKGNLMKVK